MKKKIKNSVKTEMKNMVQKELSRIMAKQISNEDFFKEMVQEVISDFYEVEKEEIKEKTSYDSIKEFGRDKASVINDIMEGKYREDFSKIINKDINKNKTEVCFDPISQLKTRVSNSKIELTPEQMNVLFGKRKENSEPEIENKLLFSQPNPHNLNILKNINGEQAIQDYERIQYTKEVIKDLFDYIEKNKSHLKAIHEQMHINNKSVEIYKIQNEAEKDLINDFRIYKTFSTRINPEYFSFEVEIKTSEITKQKIIALKNVVMKSVDISDGVIGAEDAEKLLEIAQDIYSNTTIKPLSQTEPITKEEILVTKKLKNKKKQIKVKK